jgi:ketosteroid isomerase-like protein
VSATIDLETRLYKLETKEALEDVLQAYYAAVDAKEVGGILACFTEDAVFDVSDLDLPRCHGHAEIRQFFNGIFESTAWHSHHISNFRLKKVDADSASARGYVFAKAIGTGGSDLFVHCSYDIDYVRTADGWKIRRFDEDPLIPFGDQIANLHGPESQRLAN